MAATSFNTHGRPWIVTSKRPQAAPRGDGARNGDRGVGRQHRIGVQEQQDVACGLARAGVHLQGAARCRDEGTIGEQASDEERDVAAAAIDDDDLMALCPQRLQRRKRSGNARGFFARGNDDGKTKRRAGTGRLGLSAGLASTDVGEKSGGWFSTEAQA